MSAEGFHVAQTNQGFSKRAGTLRGLHFQEGDHAQAKLVSCLHGSIFNVAVDLDWEVLLAMLTVSSLL